MRDYITLGSTPADENCAQVGAANYHQRSLDECLEFANQIMREFPHIDRNCLKIRAFPHDFGTYRELCFDFVTGAESEKWMIEVEDRVSSRWDDEARLALKNKGYDV